jgi:AGZA family xanthine/uracil permease-like MFS transporter
MSAPGPESRGAPPGWLDRTFSLSERGSTIRREVVGGLTTFMTMAYIIVVNPMFLSKAGMDFKGVVVATCLASCLATLVMGLLARYPIALAPGMGLNAFFAYEVCGVHGVSWEAALGLVFLAGVLFIVLALVRVRDLTVEVIPPSIQTAAAVGIGLFIAFIGLQKAGLVVDGPVGALVQLGDLKAKATIVAIVGLVVTAALVARGAGGGILIGIGVSAALATILGVTKGTVGLVEAPSLGEVAFKLDIFGAIRWEFAGLILIFLFFDLFDTIGTLIGVGEQAGFVKNGKLPRMGRALFSDAVGSVGAGLLGTSTVTSYIESATGVNAGARTGLANVVTALCFLLAMFFSPLAQTLGDTPQIMAPALIVVGCLMMTTVRRIPWDDFTEAFPAFVTIVVMPFTFSIAHGLAMGFITYPLIKLLAGRHRDVHAIVYVLAFIFVLRYVFL